MEEIFQLVVLVSFLYWFWPYIFVGGFSRVKKMVDIVTNRMFDAFNKLAPSEGKQNDSLSTLNQLKRFSAEQRYRRALIRDVEVKTRESQLLEIKQNLPPVAAPKSRPLVGLTCYGCVPVSRDSLVNKTTKNLPVKNILYEYPAISNKNGIFYRAFCHLSQCCSTVPYDYVQVAGSVLKDASVQNAIGKTSMQQCIESDTKDANEEEYYNKLLKNNESRATKLLNDMRSSLSDVLLRFTSWVLYKLLPCFLSAVIVHSGQVEMLKRASKNGLPLIFLPLHRSHLDYVMISFILYNNSIRCPLIASGDNLRMPFFGSLLRGLGAFYIKRRMDPVLGQKDYVYKAILNSYMNASLKNGHNIEFFLEGGRSRTGKPLMPKYGIFSVVLEALINGTIDDAYLVPVSINYDKLVDGNFVREQLGQPKQMESLSSAVGSIWQVLRSDYGMVRVDFNQPISIKEMVDTFNSNQNNSPVTKLKSKPSTSSLYGTDIVSEEHRDLVQKISKHVIYDCARSTSVMSTNALAFLLLHKFRDGTTLNVLAEEFELLTMELLNKDKDVGFSGESLDVVNYALTILGANLIHRDNIEGQVVIKPKPDLPSILELNYYSNTLAAFYSLESVIAIALEVLDTQLKYIEEDKLLIECTEICNIFAYEYIFCKPCQNVESALLDCIDDLTIHKEIFINKDVNTVQTERSRKLVQMLDNSYDEYHSTPKLYKINNNEESQKHLSLVKSLFMPLIETYSVTAFYLEQLIGKTLLENELIQGILNELRTQLDLGSIAYGESISSESIKNALKLFQKWDILECHTEDKLRLYYLKEDHDNKESIRVLGDKIDKYRFGSVHTHD